MIMYILNSEHIPLCCTLIIFIAEDKNKAQQVI